VRFAFLTAQIGDERLSKAEVVGTCLLLLLAGHETTTTLIGNALGCFDEHAEARAGVLKTPEILPTAIEEVLRFRSVLHWFPRVVKKDRQFLGHDLKEGDPVLPVFAAANRDGAQFPDPDRFDIHRSPNRHSQSQEQPTLKAIYDRYSINGQVVAQEFKGDEQRSDSLAKRLL
jgi:cytochrome P450